jgi:subtilisin family serine protease
MPRLTVTANRLNKRKAIPLHFPDPSGIIGEVVKGFTFEGVEVGKAEIPNNSLGRWFKDRDGHFYWGGGVGEALGAGTFEAVNVEVPPVSEQVPPSIDFSKMSWGHRFCEIPFIWNDLGTRGRGATVAVIDTGIDEFHEDLVANVNPQSHSFAGEGIADTDGHGTTMAGIIGASGTSKVFGVAPECSLLIIKATPQVSGVDLDVFANAINFAASVPDVDIVSISYSFSEDNSILKQAVQNCLDSKKVVVAAIGNGHIFDSGDDDRFPACYNNGVSDTMGVLSIGAFDSTGQLCNFSNWNRHLHFLAPGDLSVLTTGIGNQAVNGAGTSIATAFTAGCLALMVSYTKLHNPEKTRDCVHELLSTCDDVGPTVGNDLSSGNGRMNFRNAVSKIKRV